MIGVKKNIVCSDWTDGFVVLNHVLQQGPYETEEGCLSHTGTKTTIKAVKLARPERQAGTFTDFTAQVIQLRSTICGCLYKIRNFSCVQLTDIIEAIMGTGEGSLSPLKSLKEACRIYSLRSLIVHAIPIILRTVKDSHRLILRKRTTFREHILLCSRRGCG